MATRIKQIPVLTGKEAEAFEKKASANLANKGTVNFTKEAEIAQDILSKSKLK
jgi:hypothetical protein